MILRAYEEFGARCVDFLEGMFAFAIYDKRKRELFAARDRLGKKPFFYAELGGVFHFASELPALRRSPLWTDDIDLSSLEGYLSLGYFIAPATVFRHARKLPPASTLRVSNGCVTVASYWDVPEFDTDHRPDSEIIKEADERLRTAVNARLESEVPLGAFLSGGIDSGLVVSYMAESLGDRLVTASVGFAEPAHNELEAAGWTAKRFGSRHYSEIIRPRLDQVIGPIAQSLGEPLADSSAIPTWYLARATREHVTVALSGDGGDEGFAGYDFRYMPHALEASVAAFRARPAGAVDGLAGPPVAAVAAAAEAAASGRTPRESRNGPRHRLLHRPDLFPSGGCATAHGRGAGSRSREEFGLSRCHGPVPSLPVCKSGAVRGVRRPQDLFAQRFIGEGRSDEHGPRPRSEEPVAGSRGD